MAIQFLKSTDSCKSKYLVIVRAARQLSCTQLLLVNVAVPHAAQRPEHWIYVYDQDKLSTRRLCLLSLKKVIRATVISAIHRGQTLSLTMKRFLHSKPFGHGWKLMGSSVSQMILIRAHGGRPKNRFSLKMNR